LIVKAMGVPPREQSGRRRIVGHRDSANPEEQTHMKRLLLIGFAACTFALASILSTSAMPSANPSALATGTDSSIIQVHGWGHHGGHHYGWGDHHGWRHYHRW
jgi:hypothetical protein